LAIKIQGQELFKKSGRWQKAERNTLPGFEFKKTTELVMKHSLLTAVSIVTLIAASAPAMSAGQAAPAPQETTSSQMPGQMPAGETTPPQIPAQQMASPLTTVPAEENTYRARNIWTPESGPAELRVDLERSASGIIGKDVLGVNGEKIATVDDIIIGKDGNAEYVVVRDGGFFGMGGKLVALDYSAVTRAGAEGEADMMVPISREGLEQITEFSYTPTESATVRSMPSESLRVSELLKGKILDNNLEPLAEIDNATILNGQIQFVIVSFNKTLGVGGDRGFIAFNQVDVTPGENGKPIDITLSAEQSAKFREMQEHAKEAG